MKRWGWYLFLIPTTAIYAAVDYFTNGNSPTIVSVIENSIGYCVPNQLGSLYLTVTLFQAEIPRWAVTTGALLIYLGGAWGLAWVLQRIQAKSNFTSAIGAYLAISAVVDGLLWGALSVVRSAA